MVLFRQPGLFSRHWHSRYGRSSAESPNDKFARRSREVIADDDLCLQLYSQIMSEVATESLEQ